MYLLDFIAIIGAVGAVVNAWMHRGGLFEDWRDRLEVWASNPSDETGPAAKSLSWAYHGTRARIAQLFNCRFCLSYHVAFWLIVLFYLPSLWLAPPWSLLVKLPIYSLAATRFSLLLSMAIALWNLEDDPEND